MKQGLPKHRGVGNRNSVHGQQSNIQGLWRQQLVALESGLSCVLFTIAKLFMVPKVAKGKRAASSPRSRSESLNRECILGNLEMILHTSRRSRTPYDAMKSPLSEKLVVS